MEDVVLVENQTLDNVDMSLASAQQTANTSTYVYWCIGKKYFLFPFSYPTVFKSSREKTPIVCLSKARKRLGRKRKRNYFFFYLFS